MPFDWTMCPTFCPSYQDNLEPWRFVLGELLSSPPTLVDWASSRVWSEQFLKWWEYLALCTWEDIAHCSCSLRISISKYVCHATRNKIFDQMIWPWIVETSFQYYIVHGRPSSNNYHWEVFWTIHEAVACYLKMTNVLDITESSVFFFR